jgi:hypothetical protein
MESNSDDIIREKINILDNLLFAQKQQLDDEYNIGIYNGLVLAKSVLTGKEPIFYEDENRFEEREGVENG